MSTKKKTPKRKRVTVWQLKMLTDILKALNHTAGEDQLVHASEFASIGIRQSCILEQIGQLKYLNERAIQRQAGRTGDCEKLADAVVGYFDAMAVCDGPKQPNWREVSERARNAARELAKLAGACWHDEIDNDLKVTHRKRENGAPVERVGLKCTKCGKELVP
jgi:hypothetical protein